MKLPFLQPSRSVSTMTSLYFGLSSRNWCMYSFYSRLSSSILSICSSKLSVIFLSFSSITALFTILPPTLPLKNELLSRKSPLLALFPCQLILGGLRTPIKLRVSFIRFALILRSKGLSKARDGLRLTSSNHGLRF